MATPYLEIPNYPDPTASGNPITAIGVIGSLQADFLMGQGSIGLIIYRNLDAYQKGSDPLERVQVRAGTQARTKATKGPSTGPNYPTLPEIQVARQTDWNDLAIYFLTEFTNQSVFSGSSVKNV